MVNRNFTDPSALSADFLRWLFIDNPFHSAVGILAYADDRPVSQLFAVAQQMGFDGQRCTAGIIALACTDEGHRGRGIFQAVIPRLMEECRNVGFSYAWTIPNMISYGAFIKQGFRNPKFYGLELIPTNYLGMLRESLRKEGFGGRTGTTELPVELGQLRRFTLLGPADLDRWDDAAPTGPERTWYVPLTRAQLRWRYFGHPTRRYRVLRHRSSGVVVILRFISLFGLNAGVVMKVGTASSRDWNGVFRDLKSDLRRSVNFVTTFHSGLGGGSMASALRGRFVVPGRLSPRKFPLMTYSLGRNVFADRFELALGDYETL